ncbi:Transducin/WD40 repeat-like superfamily protein [Zea mays]|uniref:Transducin/WD40 repeat-like superfamily protein n=1 Tax=Zea mays TaxID=4577 RepID=A0A1D6JKM7_MAIZE|nr:Transducin/WD40 repeat-like superfamily protein [Zea mays]
MEVEDLEDLYNIDASYDQDDPDEDEGEQQSEDDQEMDMLGGAVAEEDGADDARGSSADEEEDEEDDEEEEEEEPEGARLVAGDCGPSPRARVSEFAAAAGAAVERAHTANCPVCMDPWTSQGPHRISCIPCGHVYGRSCLEKWLTQRGNRSATCPQCGKRFKHKDIINLYAQEVAVPNSELEKEISYLRREICSLKKMVVHHDKMFEEMIKRQNDGVRSKRQNELPVAGARVISIDTSNKIILVSGRANAIGAEYVVTKFFLTLSVMYFGTSMATDSIVLNWDLPAPGWSCAVGASGSHHIYAGLQNGMVVVFDIRQTVRPLRCMVGLSANPVHTLHSVIDNNGSRKVLSASAIGPCMWDADSNQSRPHLLTGTGDERVCISLACAAPWSDLLVASFRPRVDPSGDAVAASQVYLSQTPTRSGQGKPGQHTLIRRRTGNTCFAEGTTCYANVSELRMSKSAIIPYGYGGHQQKHLFSYGDESLRGVRTWQLPSFGMHADLCTHREPILDLRYAAETEGPGGYLGCLSEEKLQVFRVN